MYSELGIIFMPTFFSKIKLVLLTRRPSVEGGVGGGGGGGGGVGTRKALF